MKQPCGEPPRVDMRKVYGRGYFDGLKAGEIMNHAKVRAITNGMTTQARRVFDAMPPHRPVKASELIGLMKQDGIGMDLRVVSGCLNSLAHDGVVRENMGEGTFQRIEKIATMIAEQQSDPPPPVSAPASPIEVKPAAEVAPRGDLTALTRLADASVLLRQLATVLDDLGLEVETLMQSTQRDGEKMAALRDLLKSI